MGYVTFAGFQLQELSQLPSCLPGLVNFRGVVLKLKPSVLDSISIPTGSLACLLEASPQAIRERATKRKWVAVGIDDLPHFLRAAEAPRRWLYRAVGPLISGASSVVFDMSDVNALCAVLGRVFRRPKHQALFGLLDRCASFIPVLLPSFLLEKPRWTIMQWWISMPRERRADLLRCIKLYEEHGFCHKFSKFQSFLKYELSPAFRKQGDDLLPIVHGCPRLIQAPHGVGHVVAGPRLKPLLGLLKADWDWENGLFYGSRDPITLQRWLDLSTSRYPGGIVIWIDYSMYDNSYSADHWRFMYRLYGELMLDPEFAAVMSAWEKPLGRVRCFRYRGRSMNASGRDDTALANGVLNGLAVAVSLAASWLRKSVMEVTPADVRRVLATFRVSVCGDDSIIFGPAMALVDRNAFVVLLASNISLFGFEAKAYSSNRYHDAVYLGHRPIMVGGRWYWARTVGRAIYKLGFQPKVSGDPAAYMHGVMQMHRQCSRHVPVLFDIADSYCIAATGAKITPVKWDENKPWTWMTSGVSPGDYSEDTLHCLAESYSVRRDISRQDLVLFDTAVTVGDILECISYLRASVTRRVCVLDHWVLRRMILVDEQ